ncbi:hypothetical protein [Bradyrhizobium macuxiense]|uniref:hypothetical protein n=1 Tax=Bradyrhizobium macuxiense TaxID=1755647 RepID=UPI0011BE0F7F|nr:hypothetical protein [Bradyrhizobium macuxiense]
MRFQENGEVAVRADLSAQDSYTRRNSAFIMAAGDNRVELMLHAKLLSGGAKIQFLNWSARRSTTER